MVPIVKDNHGNLPYINTSLKDLDRSTGTLANDFLNTQEIRSFILMINKRIKKHHIMRNQVNNQDT